MLRGVLRPWRQGLRGCGGLAAALILAASTVAPCGWAGPPADSPSSEPGALPLLDAAREACDRGSFADALTVLEQAADRLHADGCRSEAAAALGLAARIHRQMGDVRTAVTLGHRALDAVGAGLPRNLAVRLRVDLAEAHIALLEEDDALDLLDAALALCGTPADPACSARVRLGMAHAYASLQETEEARAEYGRARDAAVRCGDDALRADVLSGTARLLASERDMAGAVARYEEALALYQRTGRIREVVETLVALGRSRRAEGDLDGAAGFYDRALRESGKAELGDLHATCLWAEARASLQRGDREVAVRQASSAVQSLPLFLRGLSEEQGAAARSTYSGLFEVGARAAMALGDDEALFYFLESGRAGTLLEFLGARTSLQSVLVAPDLAHAETEARAREAAALAAYRRVMDSEGLRQLRRARANLDRARADLKGILERIQREAKRKVGTVVPPPVPLDRFQKRIRSNEVFVLYGLFAEEAVALVLRRDTCRQIVLGPTREIERAYRTLEFEDPHHDPGDALDRLRRLLVSPLELGGDDRRVLVCPDGIVAYVPFAPLVGDRSVSYVPSATTYEILLGDRARRGEGVLALGDPVYDTNVDPCVTATVRSGVTLAPLPFTRVEAKAVGDVVLLGNEATEAGFRFSVSKRERWSSVHFACHGIVDPDYPTLSALALTATSKDDGFLTALDVFRLRIPADLVVLSACDSGVGKVVNAEGVLGLMRAFVFAGAPRVIVSLGQVSDTATPVLMKELYRQWADGVPAAEALRRAQEHVRGQRRWAHPCYWASWVLWGVPD